MSFFEQTSAMREMVATLLTPGYQVRGDLQVLGMIQTFMNDETKGIFTVKNAQVHGLEPQNPAASMEIAELYVRRDQTLLLALDEEIPPEQTGLMPREEQIAAYTSHFVVQGSFHMGTDDLAGDFIASARSPFLGVTNVHIFPLFQSRAAVIQAAALVYVYARAIRMHHLV